MSIFLADFVKKALSQLSPRLQNKHPKTHSTLDPFQHPLEAFLTRIETGQCFSPTRGHEKVHQSYLWSLVKVFQQTGKVSEGFSHNNDDILPWHCVHSEKSLQRKGFHGVANFGLNCWLTAKRQEKPAFRPSSHHINKSIFYFNIWLVI